MALALGQVVDGVVTGITAFGAFVSLPEGKNGLVHISEVSHDYVQNVSDYLKKDQKVKVKIVNIGQDGKIGLSIKQAQAPKPQTKNPGEFSFSDGQSGLSFEDKLSRFLKESNEKMDHMRSRDNRRFQAKPRKI